jgi:iron complex outermembrane receptor protein
MTLRSQFSFRSRSDLPGNLELDPTVRYVGGLPAALVPAYWTMDLRLGWNGPGGLALSAVGQNLMQPRHPESTESVNEIQRGFYLKATWRWRP